jgi:hypothetical protein
MHKIPTTEDRRITISVPWQGKHKYRKDETYIFALFGTETHDPSVSATHIIRHINNRGSYQWKPVVQLTPHLYMVPRLGMKGTLNLHSQYIGLHSWRDA